MNNQTYYRLENIINYENLYNSFEICKKGLMWKDSVTRYSLLEDYYVNEILYLFYNNDGYRYLKDPLYHTFIMERGKERLICSQTIRDRVVDKAFNINFLLPSFVPTFIYDNGASLPRKGLDFSLNRLEKFLYREFINNNGDFYYLKCDIKKFFDTIPHQYILDQILKRTNDPRIMQYFIDQFEQFRLDPYIHNGDNQPFGIGLGAETNQSFGLICLNEMDHIIKEKFQIHSYVRYMDDFVIIHKDKKYLEEILSYLHEYLLSIGLQLNRDKTQIQHIHQGILFLKVHFYINETGKIYRKPYKKTIRRLKRKMKKLSELLEEGIVTYTDIRAFYTSSLGSLTRCDCWHEIQALNDLFYQLYLSEYITEEEYKEFTGTLRKSELEEINYHIENPFKLAEIRKEFGITANQIPTIQKPTIFIKKVKPGIDE